MVAYFWLPEVTSCLEFALPAGPKAGISQDKWRAQKSILRPDLGSGSNFGQNGYLGQKNDLVKFVHFGSFWVILGQIRQRRANTQARGLKNCLLRVGLSSE